MPENERPQNLAELKRFLVPGVKLSLFLVGEPWPDPTLRKAIESPEGLIREVKRAQYNGIQFEPSPGHTSGSWFYWGAASNVVFTPDAFGIGTSGGILGKLVEYAGQKARLWYRYP